MNLHISEVLSDIWNKPMVGRMWQASKDTPARRVDHSRTEDRACYATMYLFRYPVA